ncbi:3-phosphoserine/phosphohydroxythreonine transaminase [Blastopirellula retiformator]|uniref:Phosphoserine aminotransferase n=1 Tax=Blastopirellula retiformator TaxID=2527970 RepID=A0A5C5V0S7_9BACT|nr:3-phosphoserine/phosphohydroxythreonine transaminase [Blastopirellula retiformator]TWT32048.1 Phosphoserine aminotransferase [Blastopirellula retiformator]
MNASVSDAVQRVYNFSAGPAVLPLAVLQQVQRDLIALPGVGSSILEISHRSPTFVDIAAEAKARITDLLSIPDTHDVLFLQGGSRLQFSMVPMNLLEEGKAADYVLTGSWGKNAKKEAVKEGKVQIAWDGADCSYNRLPKQSELKLDPGASFVHMTSNETIEGVQFLDEIETGDVPVVVDCSSDIFCRPLPVDKYGVIYACAQKNAGPAGVTMVIIRKDLLARGNAELPGYLLYRNHAEADSMWNTPPTFAIYVMGLVAKWLQEEIGGLAAMEKLNREKSSLLYDVIDNNAEFYAGHAEQESRSLMNVTFRLPNADVEKKFFKSAEELHLTNLKGHRSVGGVRASVYNAMPIDGVRRLADFMQQFADENK